MPILERETEIYPGDLLDDGGRDLPSERQWWAVYTLSRREKELMRRLLAAEVPFYCPLVARPSRSPSGRVRTSHVPLFSNYVFVFADAAERQETLKTNCVSRCLEVTDGPALARDLGQIRRLIGSGLRLCVEETLVPGMRVRVRSGLLQGQEGTVLRRQGETRLLVAVDFLQQGASVSLNDFDVERLD